MSSANERIARGLLATLSQDEPPPGAREKALAALCVGSAAAVASTAAGAKAGVGAAAGAKAGLGATSATIAGVLGIGKAFVAGAMAAVVAVQVGERVMAPSVDRSAKEIGPTSGPGPSPRSERPAAPTETRVVPQPPALSETAAHESSPRIDDVARQVEPPPKSLLVSTGMPTPGPAPLSTPAGASRGFPPAEFGDVSSHRLQARAASTDGQSAQANGVPSAPLDPPPTSGATDGPTLVEEIRRIDRARAALRGGSIAQAQTELDRYETDFPNGNLRPEAMVVRIELLMKSGDDARARALAQAFAAAYPTSGHLSKIRQLLARPPRAPSP